MSRTDSKYTKEYFEADLGTLGEVAHVPYQRIADVFGAGLRRSLSPAYLALRPMP
jgi:hypothetical protein